MDEKRMVLVYITKYALTTGVILSEAKVCTDDMVSTRINGGYTVYFHGKDFHFTPEDAVARVSEMKASRVRSLEKSLKKVNEMDPDGLVKNAKRV